MINVRENITEQYDTTSMLLTAMARSVGSISERQPETDYPESHHESEASSLFLCEATFVTNAEVSNVRRSEFTFTTVKEKGVWVFTKLKSERLSI